MLNKLFILTVFFTCSLMLNAKSYAAQIQDLLGVNGSPSDTKLKNIDIKWIRVDFSWKNIEKQKGKFDWVKYDKIIINANKNGYHILPILAYTPAWAGEGAQSSVPSDEKDWTKFISTVVDRYSKSPYNIKYYQIWNEPTKKAGFWKGTNEQFINIIYLPAAKIIKASGGKVVFGGWPVSNKIDELVHMLNESNAYAFTDIIDVHYRSLSMYETIYSTFIKTGLVSGIWQTEVGYTDKPYFLISEYTKILSWVIEHDWNEKNKYKIFWYPFYSNRLDFKKAIYSASNGIERETNNGRELQLFLRVFSGGDLVPLQFFSNQNKKKESSFAVDVVGKKIIYSIFLKDITGSDVTYNVKATEKIINDAKIICADGNESNYTDYMQNQTGIKLFLNKEKINTVCTNNPMFYIVLTY